MCIITIKLSLFYFLSLWSPPRKHIVEDITFRCRVEMDSYYVNLFRRPRKENDWQPFGGGGWWWWGWWGEGSWAGYTINSCSLILCFLHIYLGAVETIFVPMAPTGPAADSFWIFTQPNVTVSQKSLQTATTSPMQLKLQTNVLSKYLHGPSKYLHGPSKYLYELSKYLHGLSEEWVPPDHFSSQFRFLSKLNQIDGINLWRGHICTESIIGCRCKLWSPHTLLESLLCVRKSNYVWMRKTLKEKTI